MPPTNDSLVILLLYSKLGLPEDPEHPPLTLRQWNLLTHKLVAASLRPSDLLGQSASEISALQDIDLDYADRLAFLLDHGGVLAIELTRLESLGIWVWTRAYEEYLGWFNRSIEERLGAYICGRWSGCTRRKPLAD